MRRRLLSGQRYRRRLRHQPFQFCTRLPSQSASSTEFEAGVYFNLNVNIGFWRRLGHQRHHPPGHPGQDHDPRHQRAWTVGFDKVAVDRQRRLPPRRPGPGDGGRTTGFHQQRSHLRRRHQRLAQRGIPLRQIRSRRTIRHHPRPRATTTGFHYWAVGGSIFLEAGIPIGPGLTVNGFGGGIYHNMSLTAPPDADIRSHNTSTTPRHHLP